MRRPKVARKVDEVAKTLYTLSGELPPYEICLHCYTWKGEETVYTHTECFPHWDKRAQVRQAHSGIYTQRRDQMLKSNTFKAWYNPLEVR